jgi:hypothetical protein
VFFACDGRVTTDPNKRTLCDCGSRTYSRKTSQATIFRASRGDRVRVQVRARKNSCEDDQNGKERIDYHVRLVLAMSKLMDDEREVRLMEGRRKGVSQEVGKKFW